MLTPRHITTSQVAIACDVCGRRLLRGEHSDVFLAGGDSRNVCELCVPRATHEGWRREGSREIDRTSRRPGSGGRALLGRLRARSGREIDGLDAPLDEGAPPPERRPGELQPPPPSLRQAAAERAAERLSRSSRRAAPEIAPPATPKPVRAMPVNVDPRFVRAVELFNQSEHPRRVAGIGRSLGEPFICVRSASPGSTVVMVVVAWELSWYRYAVDLADEAAGVQLIGQGTELSELEAADRQANAVPDEHGQLELA
jgi:hypothetical protein